ncbi:hypothetical protein [Neolewinella agarilytica]|uniref:Uncharacterized protein n=1 Tax=Neolewinella agarilytica TaxID=478744 RepID=A0A1H9LZ71_9BACT|nr:hypothetical protein [Neolewinella agarilytica]SER16718.1 hypothetical protein SAMN05444359_12648 [Neolewinella agarilytica]
MKHKGEILDTSGELVGKYEFDDDGIMPFILVNNQQKTISISTSKAGMSSSRRNTSQSKQSPVKSWDEAKEFIYSCFDQEVEIKQG